MNLFKNIRAILALGSVFIIHSVGAQDTNQLREVDIVTIRTDLSAIGKKTDRIDSITSEKFVFGSIAEVLSLNSSVYIKNYGPGSIATTALRGGSASQTGLVWNGINIQNAMLGQNDLSRMPLMAFGRVETEYGGSSSLWGSGAVAGSIKLSATPDFNKGISTEANVCSGSFGAFRASSKLNVSKSRLYSSTGVYLDYSDNDYSYHVYEDGLVTNKRLKQAAYQHAGVLQDIKYLIGRNQTIDLNLWISRGHQQLPDFSALRSIPATQSDNAVRTVMSWSFIKKQYKTISRISYLRDQILYKDSLMGIYSNAVVNTMLAENEHYFTYGNHQLNIGLNYTDNLASNSGYLQNHRMAKFSLLIGHRSYLLSKKVILYPSLRLERFIDGPLPLTGGLALEYYIFKGLGLRLNSAKVYRQPTLNERYWYPGGNRDLLPEQGYTTEGEMFFTAVKGKSSLEVSGAIFNRYINNWILWLPGPQSSPTPMNIHKVWSRGTETRWKWSYVNGNYFATIYFLSSYVLSTVEGSQRSEDAAMGRQLIYTPRYVFNAGLTLGFKKTSLSWFQQYTGYRFITSDNTQWLDPYHYSSLRFNFQTFSKDQTSMNLYLACNNVFNSEYAVMAGRPMPFRNYEIGIRMKLNQYKRNITNNNTQELINQ